MLENYFEAPFTLDRLRFGPSGKYIDGFACSLEEKGYGRQTARRYIRSGAHFGHFVALKSIGLDSASQKEVKAFQQHLSRCRCPKSNGGTTKDVVRGARWFLEYVQIDCFGMKSPEEEEENQPELVKCFRHWLKQHKGVSQSTEDKYRSGATELISALGADPSKYNAKNLRHFVLKHTQQKGQGTSQTLISALRCFLRFLDSQGKCRSGLDRAIPTLANWRKTTLPFSLTVTEIQQIIESCNRETVIGIRDRAIILLLARLGLRAGDVSGMSLTDIDWRDGSVLVSGKNGRQARLPLSQEVGDAILEYLKHRPQNKSDKVFICSTAPYRPFGSGCSLSPVVTRAMRRAGISSKRYGAHLLRHSVATEMLRQGASLYEIGFVLRHRSMDVTAYYAKVDVTLLKLVAQPWPEVLR